jgi:beta-mannosidase
MELDKAWRAAAADDHLRRSYTEHDFDDAGWHPLAVPGHWRSVPAFAEADGPLLYRCRFDAPAPAEGRRAWLGFQGLLYQGDVWLDGGYLGDTEGYFVPHAFEVTGALRARTGHALAVEVTCNASRDPHGKRNITGVLQAGSYVDESWNPGGIWRPVLVTETGPVRIAALRVVCEDASPERAVLALRAVLDSDGARRVRLRTEIGGLDHEVEQPLATGTNEVNWTVRIERPELWWPRALGEAVLHDVRVAVVAGEGDGDDADPSDERRLRTGLRSVRLRRWILSVNGEPLFLKGALHGPTGAALGEAEPGEVRADVARAAEAGLDLLRVHAHVARPELYDAADEAGMLLWQDLPLHGPYARGIRRQAVRQARALVDLLGHHPAIALWCGHDEPVARDRRASPLREIATQQAPSWNRTVLDGSVRRALARADRSRPVIAHSGVAPHVPQIEGTDTHLALGWDVGDERDLASLAATLPRLVRFVTGLSAASVPPGEDRGARPLDPTDREVLDERFPRHEFATFAAWRDATQEHQAAVVRRQVEELRRLKYRPTGGFAVARLADAQPGITAALLDHERRPKPAWDALVAACRPVIVVADRLPATVVAGQQLALDVHVVSDLRRPLADAEVTATLSWPGGEREWRWAGDAGPDACVLVGTLQVAVPDIAGDLVLELSLRRPDGERVTNRDQARVVSCTP